MTTSDEIDDLLAGSSRSTGGRSRSIGGTGVALWMIASLPFLALLSLLSLAVRVLLVEGAWPELNAPDPKDLGLHYTVAAATFIGAIVSVVSAPLIALAAHFTGRSVRTVIPLVVAAAGLVVYVLVLRLDLGGLGTWFAD